jgi:hypothetical protein
MLSRVNLEMIARKKVNTDLAHLRAEGKLFRNPTTTEKRHMVAEVIRELCKFIKQQTEQKFEVVTPLDESPRDVV